MSAATPLREKVLIRVTTHDFHGNKYTFPPNWYILGTYEDYEFEYRMDTGKDFVLGRQDFGQYILDVTELGLDPQVCINYKEADESIFELYNEEEIFDLHNDPEGKCHCGEITRLKKFTEPIAAAIAAAVEERFDAWKRRRHLVSLGVTAGLPCCTPDFYKTFWASKTQAEPPWVGAVTVAEAEPETAIQSSYTYQDWYNSSFSTPLNA